MPSPEELAEMTRTSFANTPKDFTDRLEVLKALGARPGASLLDFGCSWGYGSWQFAQFGLRVKALEVSHPRAHYARDALGVDVVYNLAEVGSGFDVFFSSHVLEHVPSVGPIIELGMQKLKDGGLFVAFVPNGSLVRRQDDKALWKKAWGLKHPNFIDEVYCAQALGRFPYYIASSPYDPAELSRWAMGPDQHVGDLKGRELLVVSVRDPAAV